MHKLCHFQNTNIIIFLLKTKHWYNGYHQKAMCPSMNALYSIPFITPINNNYQRIQMIDVNIAFLPVVIIILYLSHGFINALVWTSIFPIKLNHYLFHASVLSNMKMKSPRLISILPLFLLKAKESCQNIKRSTGLQSDLLLLIEIDFYDCSYVDIVSWCNWLYKPVYWSVLTRAAVRMYSALRRSLARVELRIRRMKIVSSH